MLTCCIFGTIGNNIALLTFQLLNYVAIGVTNGLGPRGLGQGFAKSMSLLSGHGPVIVKSQPMRGSAIAKELTNHHQRRAGSVLRVSF